MEVLRGVALIAATMTTGLMAGVFALYANAIMPGLRRAGDRTFVGAFQSIDKAIVNRWFLLCFLGALVLTGLATGLHVGADGRRVLPWIASAFVLYLAAVVVTFAVNVPLNDRLQAAGDPDRIADLTAVRKQFNEARWAGWNVVRTLTATAAFGCLAWALVVYGDLS